MPYPCSRAMVSNVTTIRPDQTVGEALAIFKERYIRNVPVVDKDGKFVGLFGLKQVLMNLLPKAAMIEDGVENLSFVVGAAPGIAKRLRKIEKLLVGDVMNKEPHFAHCDTSTIEALRLMAKHGSPVVIVDKETGLFKGMISRKSLLDNLYNLLDEIEKEAETEKES